MCTSHHQSFSAATGDKEQAGAHAGVEIPLSPLPTSTAGFPLVEGEATTPANNSARERERGPIPHRSPPSAAAGTVVDHSRAFGKV